MKKEFVRNPYNYDSDEHSTATGLECKDESRTEQQHLEESDINYIAVRFLKTGEVPQVRNLPTYGDFEGIFDFQSAMNTIKRAQDEFMSLPAKLRSRFANDPHNLLEFLNDEDNREEAYRLGLLERPDTIPTPPTTGDTDGTSTERSTTPSPQKQARGARAQGTPAKDAGPQEP